MNALRTARGQLTAYGLACGYVERKERAGVTVTGWAEHGALHVRSHCHNTGARLAWECPQGMGSFRREFARQCREYLS